MVKELLNILKEKFPDFKGLYFFGSRARGDNNAESDYDFLLVFDRHIDWKFESTVRGVVCEFMINNDLLIDSIISSKKEIDNPSTPLEVNVKKEGIYYGL